MKKILILSFLLVVGPAIWAQTFSDAEKLGENTYLGTARSMGMGNAMTAVGGDLGSVGINPAGSAVAGYSQFTITPSVSMSTSGNSYTSVAGSPYTDKYNDAYSRMTMPNFGATVNVKTANTRGIKSMTFGVIGNATANYLSTVYSGGMNSSSSLAGALAVGANGISSEVLGKGNYSSFNDWRSMVAFRSGMISTLGGKDDEYIGVTEASAYDEIGLAGNIDQFFGQRTYGSKYDYLFNFGLNINDKLYLGANLGITTLNYQYDYYIKEFAGNPADFKQEYSDGTVLQFDNLRYQYSLSDKASGVYFKTGLIWRPTSSLRLGAAIQTPTTIDISESLQHAAQVKFIESSSSDASDVNEWHYRLRTPWRVNAGLAYTFNKLGIISVDYEMADYGSMKYSTDFEEYYGSSSDYNGVNNAIKRYGTAQHSVRLGAEFKPLPQFALRAGYNLFMNPEVVFYDDLGVVSSTTYQDVYNSDMSDSDFYAWEASLRDKQKISRNRHTLSLGAGWSSKGSFFADIAGRLTMFQNQYISLYNDYLTDNSGFVSTYSPEILSKQNLWDIVITLGWRF